jgi:hypothetical protein
MKGQLTYFLMAHILYFTQELRWEVDTLAFCGSFDHCVLRISEWERRTLFLFMF